MDRNEQDATNKPDASAFRLMIFSRASCSLAAARDALLPPLLSGELRAGRGTVRRTNDLISRNALASGCMSEKQMDRNEQDATNEPDASAFRLMGWFNTSTSLAAARDALLPSGELRVPDAERFVERMT